MRDSLAVPPLACALCQLSLLILHLLTSAAAWRAALSHAANSCRMLSQQFLLAVDLPVHREEDLDELDEDDYALLKENDVRVVRPSKVSTHNGQ